MTTDAIEIRTLDEAFTAVVYGELERDQLDAWLPDALATARSYLQRWGAGPKGDPFVRFVDGEVEAGYPATTPVGGEGDVEPSDLPSGDAAVMVVAAVDVESARDALRAFVAEQGNAPDGDGWEVLLDGDLTGRREVVLPFH
ncbi:MAG: Bacterial transcription activator, effector binding domain [Actinomycetia bacterium]|nr:Bacterial transcription activator, effector binding domain [Actinomycetes bacterium]